MAETTSANFPASLANDTSLLGDQVNQKSLTLSGAHTNSVTTITTTATISGVNSPGYILIDSELIHYTGTSSATLTGATRAADSTTAATHADAATIYFVPVANWANQIKREIIATQTHIMGVTNSITAGATQSQAGATALTKNINRVTVVGTNGDGVKLPTAVAGLQILIINDDSAQTIKVWPNTSDTIDGGSANAVDGSQISAGSSRRYIAVDAVNWYTSSPSTSVADDSIDSQHYVDGSIDNAHIADNAIDSEHYADGSIDTAHIADNQITLALMAGGTDGNIISYDASGDPVAIATGSDGEVLTSAGAGAPPAFEAAAGGGMTVASQWRVTADFTGAQNPIASNWEEADAPSGFGILGSSLTESSGIFTFPSTGIYYIQANGQFYYTAGTQYAGVLIYATTNNSTYNLATNTNHGQDGSSNYYSHTDTSLIFDVTDTANCKVRFRCVMEDGSMTCKGDSGSNETHVTFMRLGDT